MKFWTIQSEEVVKILLERDIYYPDINLGSKYGDMKKTYPTLLNQYNHRNSTEYNGVLFGFESLKGVKVKNAEDLYDYFYENPLVSSSLDCWSEDYCLIEIEISENVDLIPIDFNDFIKLGIVLTNDEDRADTLQMFGQMSNPYYSFAEDMQNIVENFKLGIVKTEAPSFTQVHYSHLDIKQVSNIYPIIDYKSKTIFKLDRYAQELKDIVCKK